VSWWPAGAEGPAAGRHRDRAQPPAHARAVRAGGAQGRCQRQRGAPGRRGDDRPGPESYDSISTFNGKPSASLGIELNAGANAIAVSKAIDARLQQLQKYWPHGYTAHVAFTTTPFVTISLKEVVITLIEAIVLVVLVMYLFLQNWRATLIPTIAVPVVLLGTFGVLAAFGYSINT
jgi:multidrug efflux pump subunit AcrB